MARTTKKANTMTTEEKLAQALVPDVEQPYQVPENWCWVYINAGFNVTSSKRVHKSDWLAEGIPFYRTRELVKLSEYGYVNNELFISQELYDEFKREYGIPHPDDLLISGVGTIGIPYIVKDEMPFYFKDGNIIWFQNKGLFLAKFVYFLYKSTFMNNQIHAMSAGTTVDTYTIINATKTVLPLPPLAEQQRIVEKIDQTFSVLDTIDTLQAQYADNLTALKAKLIDAAIRGKLTEQLPEDGTAEELYQKIQAEKQELIRAGKIKKEKPLPEIVADEISIEIPANWKSCRLGSIITLVSGTDYKPEEYNAEMRGTPYITGASNLLPEGVLINRWTETPRCIANKGDVLLVCKGSGYGKVAMCDIEEAHIARQIMALKKTDLLDMRYILYYLVANFSYLKGKGQGLIPGVDRKSVLNMIFPLPPLAEQKRITQKIDELLSLFEK